MPQVSQSTLWFLDIDTLRNMLEESGPQIEQQFGDFDEVDLCHDSPEIITFAIG